MKNIVTATTLKKIAILTSKTSCYVSYVQELISDLKVKGYKVKLIFDANDSRTSYDVVFILSYFNIVSEEFLEKHKYNLVVHASALPKGRGWSPLFWQTLEGKEKIPIVLFEANRGVDEGPIYIKDYICLKGHELHDEIRRIQAEKTAELCKNFLKDHKKIVPKKQKGKATYYRKRAPKDSELNINKTIKEQFNLLRIVNNEEFPAFFYYRGQKYELHVSKSK